MMISIISLFIAIALVFISLPTFNNLTGKVLSIRAGDGYLWSGMLGIAILTGFLAGSYPAIFLSGFNPVTVLKGKLNMGGGSLLLRNSLVILQFCTAIILLTGTVVVYMQLNFIKNRNLGFEKSNLIYMRMTGDIWNKMGALRSVLAENSQTRNFTIISNLPVNLTTGEANVQWEGKDPNLKIVIPSLDIDENFLSIFKIDLLQGRGFSRDFNGDSTNYLINEKAMKVMGMKSRDVPGQKLSFNGVDGSIIGVIKDFNFKPLQYPIEPLVLRLSKNGGVVVVKADPGGVEGTLKQLEKVNAQLNPAYPFSFNFVDSDLDNLYRGERQMGRVFQLFALLSILISCVGLYGLSAFIAEQRKREIAVRKVLGASSGGIVYLLSGKFTQLILLALVIAMPISLILIHNWLKGFEYRITLPWTIFLYVPLLTLVVAWLTVGTESIKAASSNPIKSLRNE
jgi:ABC-type antimicrobial peptide transport system permease subunit